MATKYVFSGAAGANDGSSWANAWTSISSITGTSPGDEILVHKTHSESGASFTIALAANTAPIKIICVDKDAADALATGATITATTFGVNMTSSTGNDTYIVYGMTFVCETSFTTTVLRGVYEECTIRFKVSCQLGGSGTDTYLRNVIADCSISGSASVAITGGGNGPRLRWIGGEYITRSTQTAAFSFGSVGGFAYIAGIKITTTTLTNLYANASSGDIVFERCEIGSYTNLIAATASPTARVLIIRGVSGTVSLDPLGLTKIGTYYGEVSSELSSYRSDGADDNIQANEHSWKMVTTANPTARNTALISPPITKWVAAGSQTVTLYLASGGTLNNEELWLELLYGSEVAAGSTTAKGTYKKTRANFRASAANLTTDGASIWNGSGVGTKQKIDVAIDPEFQGPLTAYVHFSKPSGTVYIDPKLAVA